ncbi:hypothetical protein [Neptunitalea lumnitzerae]|uniref:Photosystem I assembly protein Ycf4 n=1 Tax=Neptunitalea lumnitzerae TaxID=2965509 RepID=A0ABQ5MJ25_9FLAO|nr:hypothetical protein [Neptunitalea sp. Y10]GLB48942.1 hypothetical protein Y10_13100 [Neptunitalea sp. Y10]
MNTEFYEKQRIGNWIFIILGVDFIMILAIMFNQYNKGEMPLKEFVIAMSIVTSINILSALLIVNMIQHTKIDINGIHYKYPPFAMKFRTIPLESITSFQIESYDKLNYGYGMGKWNFFKDYDMITSMGLEKVIRIEYGAKKPILIGTKKPNEFYTLLKKLKTTEQYG